MTNDWHEIHVSDKTGGVFFKTVASPMATESEIKNLKSHIKAAKQYRAHYSFLDADSAHIVLDGERYDDASEMSLDDILAELAS
jgi:hypothetical protein